ncbi:CHAT domain-containing protein [Streptomyces sp. R41]|uniref:CHAT domain-containing protein n=1 Tax=Streptomyces sp. R41 TaxID=3238632 RepID=A0AB39RIX3_9ACTN
MTELQDRVVARLVAAQNARDPAPLRGEDAVGDALALLREAAPSPEGTIDLDSVAAVCWTFWLRHQGPEDPDAQRNVLITLSTFGFLCPRVPADAQLPVPLRDAFDPADPAHEARFAYLVSSAYGGAVGGVPEFGETERADGPGLGEAERADGPGLGEAERSDGPGLGEAERSDGPELGETERQGAAGLGDAERLAALDCALAWSETAHQLLPDGHEGFVELAFHSLGLGVTRFRLAADPDALAAAARHAAAVCERLWALGPEGRESGDGANGRESGVGAMGGEGNELAEAAAIALGTLLDAARLLGEPPLAEVERLVAGAPEGALTPEAAEALRFLRELHTERAAWPGEKDLRVGSVIADAGIREHDASRIACGVRRLRAALAHTPAEHPAHPVATAALSQALAAFAQERGDDGAAQEAAREAIELLATVDASRTLSDADQELLTAYRGLTELIEDDDPQLIQNAGPLLGHFVEQLRQRAARDGESAPAPDIDLEILDIVGAIIGESGVVTGVGESGAVTSVGESGADSGAEKSGGAGSGAEKSGAVAGVGKSGAASDERIARYRTALAGLPADKPQRYAYVAVLAALTGAHAQALRETEPARAAELGAEARTLTDEVAADAPDGFLALGLLRRGLFDAALPVAVAVIHTDEADAAADLREMAKLVSLVSRLDDVRLDDPEQLSSDIAVMRELLADTGEDDPFIRAPLAGALGSALSAQGVTHGDPGTLDEAVPLLRYARTNAPDLPGQLDQVLAFALTTWSVGRFDAEAAREAAALLATAATEAAPDDVGQAWLSVRTEFFNAVGNYLLGHEPGQLQRARELARRLKELTARADAQAGDLPGLDVLGDALLNLVDTMGPGGGPKPDLTDDQVDQCRRTFAACPAGHPMRLFTASTLMRALAQRAVAVRAADPERAARLVAEADEVIHSVEEEAPGDWAETMRTFTGVIGAGHLPPPSVSHGGQPEPSDGPLSASDGSPERPSARPLSSPDGSPERPSDGPVAGSPLRAFTAFTGAQASSQAPANAVEAMMASLRARLSGTADSAAALRDPMLPAWFRAHGELGAAAGALGREQQRVDLALSHLETAIEAMADVTDRGSDQQSAEHGLTTFEGDIRRIIELVLLTALGRGAAAGLHEIVDQLTAAVREQRLPDAMPDPETLLRVIAGPDVDRATELLERGRGLLLARRIEARADIGELRSAHPALAREFERLTDRLAAEPHAAASAPAGHAEWSRLAKLRASRELDELVVRIRTQPGFDGFLRPLSAEQLRSLASDGPIVVLNHAARHCHALVVTPRSITALRLEAESDEIAGAARRLGEAVDAINAHGPSRPSPAQLIAAGGTLRRTLSWTWHKIVRPVLDLVGASDPVPDDGTWPRIWWVPTGAFNALPLHAAQCTLPDCALDGCGAALDAVVSSYVPGFQTLAYARSRAEHRDTAHNGGALLVASSEDELPGVAAAAGYAAGLLGAREPLIGAAATREAVLAALGGTPWAHFGCHAATDPTEPSGALLHLPSGEPLSVLEICRARPSSARLAFLAACGTARTAERLSDEAIHITSAFLLAGFPTAVGTLWEIDSTHADHVTRDFYRRMAPPATNTSAHALHHTVRELRHRIPDRPHVWAAYVHAGT